MRDSQVVAPRMDLARATLGVLFIVTLLVLTVWVLRPFLGAIIWATMIVVATWPVMRHVQSWLLGSRKLAAAAMTGVWLLVLVLPLWLATGTIIANAGQLAELPARLHDFTMPPPPEWLGNLPAVGAPAAKAWQRIAASPVGDLAKTAAPYAVTAVAWTAGTIQSVGLLLVQFLLTLAIAAVMYVHGERAGEGVLRFGRHLGGAPGDRVIRLATQAIRGVALGVVVTAAVQAGLAGIGLWITGVPYVALLAFVSFILCIAQLGPAIVLAPCVGWLYWQGATGAATLLLIWMVVVLTLDNVLRPYLMTKGANLPMLLMFAGVLGGLLAFGLIGIFVGPVVLAVSYTLLLAWVDVPASSSAPAAE